MHAYFYLSRYYGFYSDFPSFGLCVHGQVIVDVVVLCLLTFTTKFQGYKIVLFGDIPRN